jgi:hypothetical protein
MTTRDTADAVDAAAIDAASTLDDMSMSMSTISPASPKGNISMVSLDEEAARSSEELAAEIAETNDARVTWLKEKAEVEELLKEELGRTPSNSLKTRIERAEQAKRQWLSRAKHVEELMGQQANATPENVVLRSKLREETEQARDEWLQKQKKVNDIIKYYENMSPPDRSTTPTPSSSTAPKILVRRRSGDTAQSTPINSARNTPATSLFNTPAHPSEKSTTGSRAFDL